MSWLSRHLPTQHTIHQYRLLRPFATQLSRPALWRLTHRSVPRAAALGLFVAILIPIMHTVIAALLAIPARANIAIAAAVTLVVNPVTIPPLYYAAYRLGAWELHHDRLIDPAAAERVSGELGRMLFWLHQASGPIAVGMLTIAIGTACVAYLLTAIGWRAWLANRVRQRRLTRHSGPLA